MLKKNLFLAVMIGCVVGACAFLQAKPDTPTAKLTVVSARALTQMGCAVYGKENKSDVPVVLMIFDNAVRPLLSDHHGEGAGGVESVVGGLAGLGPILKPLLDAAREVAFAEGAVDPQATYTALVEAVVEGCYAGLVSVQ